MKKLFAFISILAVMATAVFAEVTAKKNADGSVDVTFFYGNPRASEVLLAGDFTNWQDGALPMEKGDKGFSLTKTFKASDVLTYKFISDGNWTTDLRAPEFVDDGFGGKNSRAEVADLVGGADDAAAAGKAKINFVSWTMFGVQSKFKTQGVEDATKKGLDMESVSFGAKSYDKFVGTFLPNCPLYVELALMETPLDNEVSPQPGADTPIYLYKKNAYDVETVEIEDGLKDLFNGLFTNPVSFLGQTTNNKASSNSGKGSHSALGALKFGFNTPYVNFSNGYMWAKPDSRAVITWTTLSSGWDAGYEHMGGWVQFSNGSKVEQFGDATVHVGFAPNRSADRRGYKYGYWAFADVTIADLVIDFQSNGMYDGEYIFKDPVEHDFIVGAKDVFAVGDGKLKVAAQALVATHQKSSDDIKKDNIDSGAKYASVFNGSNPDCVGQYFGHSTDVFYRSGDFDGIKQFAANAQAGYETEKFGANVEYRMRGAQASMLYNRENHDDGTFDLSDELGVLNSQRIKLDGFFNATEQLTINLGVTAEMALENLDVDDEWVTKYSAELTSWYKERHLSEMCPIYGVDGGAEFVFKPAVTYVLNDNITLSGYADMKLNAYKYSDKNEAAGATNDYAASDCEFLFKVAGVTANMKLDNDVVKAVDVYYGFDNSNAVRLFNTLGAKVSFPNDIAVTAMLGLKTIKDTDAADASAYDADSAINNPFGFGIGVSKQLKALKKPIVYAQFVFNTDPYKDFGAGQEGLNLDRANMKGIYDAENRGAVDPVDYYDGEAAMRVGIRWDI